MFKEIELCSVTILDTPDCQDGESIMQSSRYYTYYAKEFQRLYAYYIYLVYLRLYHF